MITELDRKEYLYEHAAKVCLVIGSMRRVLVMEDWDWEDIWHASLRIAIDWDNQVDIRDFEEQGYCMPYAQRVLIEQFRKDIAR